MAVASHSKVVPVLPKTTAPAACSRIRQAKKHRPNPGKQLGLIDPRSPQFPNWLIVLMAVRKLSTPVLLFLVMGVLPLYAWRVSTQQSWGNQFTALEQLQQDERTWLTRMEERKYEISENLESNPAGFVPKSSKTTIFFQPAPPRPTKAAPSPQANVTPVDVAPIGY